MNMYTWLKICNIFKYVFWGYFRYVRSAIGQSPVTFCIIYHNLKSKRDFSLGLWGILNGPAALERLRNTFFHSTLKTSSLFFYLRPASF